LDCFEVIFGKEKSVFVAIVVHVLLSPLFFCYINPDFA